MTNDYIVETLEDAIKIIKKQQAEIESLQKVRANILKVMKENISQTKSEAIKEFAERVKERAFDDGKFVCTARIDNLVKEMTEVSENVC